jgi:hypothetical protein
MNDLYFKFIRKFRSILNKVGAYKSSDWFIPLSVAYDKVKADDPIKKLSTFLLVTPRIFPSFQ